MRAVAVASAFGDAAEKRIGALLQLCARDGIALPTLILLAPNEAAAQRYAAAAARVVALIAPHYDAQLFLPALCGCEDGQTLWIFDSSIAGAELSVRLSARLGGGALTGVQSLRVAEDGIYAQKAVYSNHLCATFRIHAAPAFVSLAAGLPSAPLPALTAAQPEIRRLADAVEGEWIAPTHGNDLLEAKTLVAVGRGAGSREGAQELARLAEDIGAACGATRQVAMNAWMPMDRLIGVSGAMTHPNSCIALGASGAAAFYAGIARGRHIAAVNTDANAPICAGADVVIEGDCVAFMRRLAQLVRDDAE